MARARAITESEYQAEALPALRSVFVSDDPVGTPISAKVSARAIWYPVGFRLDPDELLAVETAARGVGEMAMYLSVLERPPDYAQDRAYHWFIPFDEIGTYSSLGHAFVLENALYSTSGKWGIMTSQFDHALVAGTAEFVAGLFTALSSTPEESLHRLLDYWRAPDSPSERAEWLPNLLGHVLGPHLAATYLRDLHRP